jgi:enoyl-CoA hydratase/carnithine racemase
VGADRALALMTAGEHVQAEEAVALRLCDELVPAADDTGAAALAAALALAAKHAGAPAAALDARRI